VKQPAGQERRYYASQKIVVPQIQFWQIQNYCLEQPASVMVNMALFVRLPARLVVKLVGRTPEGHQRVATKMVHGAAITPNVSVSHVPH